MNAKMYAQQSAAALAAALVFLAGCKQNQETPTSASASAAKPAKPAIVSAEKTSFAEITSKLDPGGRLFAYVSTEQIVSDLSNRLASVSNIVASMPDIPGTGRDSTEKIFTLLAAIAKDSGISQISGLGMSSIAREKGFYYSKLIVHHYPGQNAGLIWSLFGRAPHPLQVMDFLPQSTALAASMDFDLPLAWTNIAQGVQSLNIPEASNSLAEMPEKFRQLTGLDLDAALQSFGGEYGIVLTLDPGRSVTLPMGDKSITIPNPGLCLVFKVHSDLIFDRVDQYLSNNPVVGKMVFRTDEPGFKMRTVPIPLPIPLEVHPSMARVGDYLLLASSDTMVREMLAVKSGKKKGFKTTDAFKRLSQGVPEDGNNFILMTRAFAGAVGQIQQAGLAGQNMDPQAVQSFQQMMQGGTNVGSYSVALNGPDGWEGVGNGGSEDAQTAAGAAITLARTIPFITFPNDTRSTRQRAAEVEAVLQAVSGIGDVFFRPMFQAAPLLGRQGADDFGGRTQNQ
jgi:hypothetical protein